MIQNKNINNNYTEHTDAYRCSQAGENRTRVTPTPWAHNTTIRRPVVVIVQVFYL